MTSLKRELSAERSEADERLLKKMRLEKQPTFHRKANEKQYQFNLEVKDKLDEAATALAKHESTSEVKSKALKTLEEGMK